MSRLLASLKLNPEGFGDCIVPPYSCSVARHKCSGGASSGKKKCPLLVSGMDGWMDGWNGWMDGWFVNLGHQGYAGAAVLSVSAAFKLVPDIESAKLAETRESGQAFGARPQLKQIGYLDPQSLQKQQKKPLCYTFLGSKYCHRLVNGSAYNVDARYPHHGLWSATLASGVGLGGEIQRSPTGAVLETLFAVSGPRLRS